MATTDGSGATATFSGLTGDVTGISWSGMERETIEATHLGSVAIKEYVSARLYDGGEITLEINVDDDCTTPLTTYAATGGSLVLTFKDDSDTTITATINAICTSCDPLSVSTGEAVTASMSFKVNGVPVWS